MQAGLKEQEIPDVEKKVAIWLQKYPASELSSPTSPIFAFKECAPVFRGLEALQQAEAGFSAERFLSVSLTSEASAALTCRSHSTAHVAPSRRNPAGGICGAKALWHFYKSLILHFAGRTDNLIATLVLV